MSLAIAFLALVAFLLYLLRKADGEIKDWRDRYLDLERESRARESKLLDRFLVTKGVAPVEADRPGVVKFPDPDTPALSAADELWRLDEIKQMMEEREPGVALMYLDEARAKFPDLYAACEQRYEDEHAPLLK